MVKVLKVVTDASDKRKMVKYFTDQKLIHKIFYIRNF